MRVLILADLHRRGINFHRVTLWKLEREGKFPRRIKLGAVKFGWIETEIDQFLADRMAARNAA